MADQIAKDLKKYAKSQQLFGMFSTAFNGTGDPFLDGRQTAPSRIRGAQFQTNKAPIPSRFLRLFEGDSTRSVFDVERKAAVEQRKLNITPEGFKYPSKPKRDLKKPLFGPIAPNMPESYPREKGVALQSTTHEARQFVTGPSKRGFGNTPGITFGPPAPKEDPKKQMQGKEYVHEPSPYDEALAAEKAGRRKHAELLAGRPPMKPVGRSIDFFDNLGVQVVACPGVVKESEVPKEPLFREKPREERKQLTPFKPAKGGVTDPKMPPWMPDPDSHKEELHKKEMAEIMRPRVPFIPPTTPKSMAIKSVMFHAPGVRP